MSTTSRVISKILLFPLSHNGKTALKSSQIWIHKWWLSEFNPDFHVQRHICAEIFVKIRFSVFMQSCWQTDRQTDKYWVKHKSLAEVERLFWGTKAILPCMNCYHFIIVMTSGSSIGHTQQLAWVCLFWVCDATSDWYTIGYSLRYVPWSTSTIIHMIYQYYYSHAQTAPCWVGRR